MTLPIRKPPITVAGPPVGITPLRDLSVDRSAFLLIGAPGIGKTSGAATFGGGDYGRVLVMLFEMGQEGGAGGVTPLKFLTEELGVREDEVDVLLVRNWKHAQEQHRWVVEHVRELWEEHKIRTLVIDGITEACVMIVEAMTSVQPAQIGVDRQDQRSLLNSLVRNIDGTQGRDLEKGDYQTIMRKMRTFIGLTKLLPFRVVATALEGDMYGDSRQGPESTPIGTGPDLSGRQVVRRVCAQFDFVFHCEQQVRRDRGPDGKTMATHVSYVWLTQNNVQLPGNTNPYYAKTRSGFALERYVPANGRAVLKALGFVPPPLDTALPAGPSASQVAEVANEA